MDNVKINVVMPISKETVVPEKITTPGKGIELLEGHQIDFDIENQYQIILFNDNVNTFEDVIEGLMSVCRMNINMAFKTAMEAHMLGKTVAHVGDKDECQKMKSQLECEYQLTVQVEMIY